MGSTIKVVTRHYRPEIVAKLFDRIEADGVSLQNLADVTLVDRKTVYNIRKRGANTSIVVLEALAQMAGYRLTLMPLDGEPLADFTSTDLTDRAYQRGWNKGYRAGRRFSDPEWGAVKYGDLRDKYDSKRKRSLKKSA